MIQDSDNSKPIYETMLTTSDNPFDPFTQYDEWSSFDISHGYNTSAYLARVLISSPNLSEVDQIEDVNDAIREVVELNLTGNYKIVRQLYVEPNPLG